MTGPGGHHPSGISRLADLRVVVDRVEAAGLRAEARRLVQRQQVQSALHA